MLFSVIYSIDTCGDVSVKSFNPPRSRAWELTESGKSEYDYLEGAWAKGKHRKWCALLTKAQFNEFVSKCGLIAEDVETMGSLGAPGCGFGFSSAISFNAEHYEAICNAYVTPLCRKDGASEKDWDRVRRAMLSIYG